MKLKDDLKAYTERESGFGKIKKGLQTVLLNPCFHSVILYRLSNFLYKIHIALLAKIVWYINRLLFHIDIDYRANLAGGLRIVHGLGIVVGRGVISKGRLTLYQGVTVGGSGRDKFVEIEGEKHWMPVLDKNVVLYTDAKVFGPVYICENAKIKAGTVITRNIESIDDKQM